MEFLKNIQMFFKKTETYIKDINKLKWSYFITLIFLFLAVKTGFNVISSHDFPPELSFDKTGIINPTVIEYLVSSALSLLINFLIFIPAFIFNIKTGERMLKFFLFNLFILIIFLIPFLLKIPSLSIAFAFLLLLSTVMIIYKNSEEYLFLLKAMLSLSIISIISVPFIFLAEQAKSESFYTLLNIFFAVIYIFFYIKIIKIKYDLSINRILLYSISSAIFSFLFGFILYKSMIFNSNIMKLMLYQ